MDLVWLLFLFFIPIIVHPIPLQNIDSNCITGAYRIDSSNSGVSESPLVKPICAGYQSCPAGFFCQNGLKSPCSAGSYGNQTRITASTCTGPCPPGYYCPIATITPYPCTAQSTFCPLGSSSPSPVQEGYYSDPLRAYERICPAGSYCTGGSKYSCPAGSYGFQQGLRTSVCSGPCPPGFYCPIGTVNYMEYGCGLSTLHYCAVGSEHPLLVDAGYYAADPVLDLGGGYSSQQPCLPGTYCKDGVAHPCPGEYYGAMRLETRPLCSGACSGGYFCPPGSTSSRQMPCGGPHLFCPPGSAAPMTVLPGFYSFSTDESTELSSELVRTDQRECEVSFYCVGGVRRPCPAGYYGDSAGMTTAKCSGFCREGYYCNEGSSAPTQRECGSASVVCPLGSPRPRPVQPGYYSVGDRDNGTTQSTEHICEPGFYCSSGVRLPCTAGTYGSKFGEVSANCTGLCAAGYFCPAGSSSAEEEVCGGFHFYCPLGSVSPSLVFLGYVSIGGDLSARTSQRQAAPGYYAFQGLENLCPGGTFGSEPGLTTPQCSGNCAPGFFCPPGSTSPYTRRCGSDNLYCPEGSAEPSIVYEGFYTAYYVNETCAPGFWRNYSSVAIDFSVAHPSTIVTLPAIAPCVPCPVNTYKSYAGDDVSLCLPCPLYSHASQDNSQCICDRILLRSEANSSLYFNISSGQCNMLPDSTLSILDDSVWVDRVPNTFTRSQQFECERGYFCVDGVKHRCPGGFAGALVRETRPQCSDVCVAGYYCPEGSSSPYQHVCGDSSVFCPAGSAYPLLAVSGTFTINGGTTVIPCPIGFSCVNGVATACPGGTFPTTATSTICDGVCEPGYYCPVGSGTGTTHECGSPAVYCPPGSAAPIAVTAGFYCWYGVIDFDKLVYSDTSRHRCSVELPCEPGYYCSGGLKIACPPGTFSWRYGLKAAGECTLCGAGYYCPSTLAPQPDAPPFTVWPGVPQTVAADSSLQCGGDNFYCPRGTAYPQAVTKGHYSYGGTNQTRWHEAICPLGWYCSGGIAQPCANGRYGNSTGLSGIQCSGLCPAGSYCPEGTSQPLPCAVNYYSVSGAWACSPCPGHLSYTSNIPCQTSRSCCFVNDL